jgi:predicted site-specific integrase-resolvase
MSTEATPPKTIPLPEAARRMGLKRDRVARLVRKGMLGVVKYPGLRTQVIEADVQRLIDQSVVPARATR